jgi:GDP-L-fucose synthase
VIAGLVRKCYEAKNSSGGSFTVSGTGKPLRQFVFSEDLAAVILRMLDENLVGDYIFCNDDEEVSIASVASLIGKETDFKGFITFDTSQADGVFSKTATCTKLKSALGDIGFTPLEEGIRKTVNWYKNHYSTDGIRN